MTQEQASELIAGQRRTNELLESIERYIKFDVEVSHGLKGELRSVSYRTTLEAWAGVQSSLPPEAP